MDSSKWIVNTKPLLRDSKEPSTNESYATKHEAQSKVIAIIDSIWLQYPNHCIAAAFMSGAGSYRNEHGKLCSPVDKLFDSKDEIYTYFRTVSKVIIAINVIDPSKDDTVIYGCLITFYNKF